MTGKRISPATTVAYAAANGQVKDVDPQEKVPGSSDRDESSLPGDLRRNICIKLAQVTGKALLVQFVTL
jgi:hypothetical protein